MEVTSSFGIISSLVNMDTTIQVINDFCERISRRTVLIGFSDTIRPKRSNRNIVEENDDVSYFHGLSFL